MPVTHDIERDLRRWQRTMVLARKQMLLAGWIELSPKFSTERLKKARKLYPQMK